VRLSGWGIVHADHLVHGVDDVAETGVQQVSRGTDERALVPLAHAKLVLAREVLQS